YHYAVIQRPNFRPERIPEILKKTADRLQKVQIESMPYEEILKRYDRPTTLFYLDPPYWGRKLYRFNFEKEDFERLSERLSHIKGKFILSLNEGETVEEIFKGFLVRKIRHSYTAQR